MLKHAQKLDENQKIALDLFQAGRNVALVGGGGTGKSYLLKSMIEIAEQKIGTFPSVTLCALSNRAAEGLNGITIHKLFGAKPSCEFSKEYLLEGLTSKPGLCDLLRMIQVLIIDEISLLSSNVIDAIDHALRHFSASEWHSSLPLGGRQLVLSGDPYQLEPYEERGYVQRDSLRTAFQSRTWYLNFGPPGNGVVINPKNNHRQSQDPSFFAMLNRIRVGAQTPSDIKSLNSLCNCSTDPPPRYTRLCLTNEQVARINKKELDQIPGPFHRVNAADTVICGDQVSLERRLECVAPRVVTIKVGACVIITRKLQHDEGIVPPGVRGAVRRIERSGSYRAGTKFMIMLELSSDFTFEKLTQEPRQGRRKGAVVRFSPVSFEIHRFDRSVVARTEQLPLISAYAITIHRSQGLKLSRVAIDFQIACNWKPHAMCYIRHPIGMAYVALSRCRSTRGLRIRGLKDHHVSISERANDLMKELWELHMHMPSRIWGVSTPSCLNLSNDDIAGQFHCTNAMECSYDTAFLVSDGLESTERPVSTSTLSSTAESNSDYRAQSSYAHDIALYRDGPFVASSGSSKLKGKRGIDSVRIVDDQDSDLEIVFVHVVKKRRRANLS